MESEKFNDKGLIDAALVIATEREENTRQLARAVLKRDYETATRLATELLPNEAQRISNSDLGEGTRGHRRTGKNNTRFSSRCSQ